MRTEFFFRFLVAVVFGWGGWRLGALAGEGLWFLPLSLGGLVVGAIVGPYLTNRPLSWLMLRVSQMPTPTLLAGVVGLLIALLSAALLTLPLSLLPGVYGRVLPLLVAFLLSYVIITIIMSRAREFFRFLGLSERGRGGEVSPEMPAPPLLVDTSALIDGRIADVAHSGFLMGELVIPRFVLQELQQIADSGDSLRRRRGRRGLEMLSKIQKESQVPIQISEEEAEGEAVDDRLVQLAKTWRCPIITTDFNLNRVAELQGVKVLNLNDLATGLKPVVLPGEEMEIKIIQEGKEAGQGVGFLDDGTMVVVEGGRRLLNSRVAVVITRVLQTAVGRMIFAQPKDGASRERGEKE